MASFILVHGSWHGAWCWERVIPHMQADGHEVLAIDLPAHGADRSPAWLATMHSYAKCIVHAARELSDKPILVGHSMGGMAITHAAAMDGDAFAGLVYLCAFVPRRGDSLMTLGRSDPGSLVTGSFKPGLSGFQIRGGRARSVFYNTCSAADADWAAQRLRPDPIRPMLARLDREPPTSLPRACIVCTEDRAVSIEHQRNMAARASIERIVTMKTDHPPFLSAPRELADRIAEMTG